MLRGLIEPIIVARMPNSATEHPHGIDVPLKSPVTRIGDISVSLNGLLYAFILPKVRQQPGAGNIQPGI